MNLLSRSRISARLISSSPSPRKSLFYRHPVAAFQQCNNNLYSTKTTQKAPQPSKTHKSPQPYTSFTQRIKKQTEKLTNVWPKPREIPYQEKVANFVNLIGRVKVPVRFESGSDGKHLATTVISIGRVDERNSMLIPVVFEGDLAHVVACHVKEGDDVFVSGQLSEDPLLGESLGKFHVVAENLNYVEGLEKKWPVKGGVGESVFEELREECRTLGEAKKVLSSSIEDNVKPLVVVRGDGEGKPSGESATKKKDADEVLDMWRDLVKNPKQWWDYRDHKSSGLVKERFPDFKKKVTGESLWISSAPDWVLPGIAKLEFDVKDVTQPSPFPNKFSQKQKQVEGGGGPGESKKNGKSDDSWKSLVENPDQWWDNRKNKKSPKAPDFKHKETGEALWLGRSPSWAVSRLPPM